VPDEQWRAFKNWKEAIDDFLTRISPTSQNAGYQSASRYLIAGGPGYDARYWDSIIAGGYYTAPSFDGEAFSKLVARVRSEIFRADPAQNAKAQDFALNNIDHGSARGWWGLVLLAVVGGLIGWALTRKG
jgi:hypothetical protein